MKKSINAFQVEKLENRKEFIFYCLLCCILHCHNGGGTGTPGPGEG